MRGRKGKNSRNKEHMRKAVIQKGIESEEEAEEKGWNPALEASKEEGI